MKKKTQFYCSLYGINYYFLRSENVMDCQPYMEEKVEDQGQHGWCFELDNEIGRGIFLWINNSHPDVVSNLVHESIHAASFVFVSRGIKFSLDNDESFAYYVQWIFDKCFKTIPRSKK